MSLPPRPRPRPPPRSRPPHTTAPAFPRFQQERDPQALAEVFDAAAPQLLRLALHLSRDPNAAEDLVQTTFLVAIEHRMDYDPGSPLLPWLFGILHNRLRVQRRTLDL